MSDIDADARKERSEGTLRSVGIPVNPYLPRIESIAQSTRRHDEEVAARAVALMLVAVKGEGHARGADPDEVSAFIARVQQEYGLAGSLTPAEQHFMDVQEPDERTWTQFVWRYEACWVMHWALGFVDRLGPPSTICDAATTVEHIHARGREGYLAQAQLRPQTEILEEADLIYRYHWAVRDAYLRGGQLPNVEPGVVQERHHARNWLIGYDGQDWDDISTDT